MMKTKIIGLLIAVVLTTSSCATGIPAAVLAGAEGGATPAVVEEMPTQFNYGQPEPAMQAFRVVARERGWLDKDVAGWSGFVESMVGGESAYCPNLRRGASLVGDGTGCIIDKQGPHSDSGFGQVLMGYPNRAAWQHGGTDWDLNEHASWLCAQEGLCVPDDVIADPHSSMTALVALIERSGKAPWCFTDALRRSSRCRTSTPW